MERRVGAVPRECQGATVSLRHVLFPNPIQIAGTALAVAVVMMSVTQAGSDPERIAMFYTVDVMNDIAGDDLDKAVH